MQTWLKTCLSSFEESCSISSSWCNTFDNREDVKNIFIREGCGFLVVKIIFFQWHLDTCFLAEFTKHADFLDTVCVDEWVNVVAVERKIVRIYHSVSLTSSHWTHLSVEQKIFYSNITRKLRKLNKRSMFNFIDKSHFLKASNFNNIKRKLNNSKSQIKGIIVKLDYYTIILNTLQNKSKQQNVIPFNFVSEVTLYVFGDWHPEESRTQWHPHHYKY